MIGSMTTKLFKQHNFPEPQRFYLKQQHQHNIQQELSILQETLKPKLKITIVTETWSPEINGVANSLLQLCKGLQKLGHRIQLIRPIQKTICTDFQAEHECLVWAKSIPKYADMQFGMPQYVKVSKAIERFAPDVVHIVTEGPLGLTALYAAQAHQIPVSSGFHSTFHDFSRFFDLALLVKPIESYLRWFHNHTVLTCVPSQTTLNQLQAFGVTCPLVEVGRGVDTTRFPSRASLRTIASALASRCKYFGAVICGTFISRKRSRRAHSELFEYQEAAITQVENGDCGGMAQIVSA